MDGSTEHIERGEVAERCRFPDGVLGAEMSFFCLRDAYGAEQRRRLGSGPPGRALEARAAARAAGVKFEPRPFYDRVRSATPLLAEDDLLVFDLFSGRPARVSPSK